MPAAIVVDPLVSVVIGAAIFDERFLFGPLHGLVLLGLLGVLGVSTVRLAILAARDALAVPALPA